MRVAIMEKTKEIAGICSTCNHIEDCLHRLGNGMVIWLCEQFDDYVPQKPRLVPKMSKPLAAPSNQEAFRGLCVNCEHRLECIHSKTPGGIWHCEEYL